MSIVIKHRCVNEFGEAFYPDKDIIDKYFPNDAKEGDWSKYYRYLILHSKVVLEDHKTIIFHWRMTLKGNPDIKPYMHERGIIKEEFR